MPSPRSRILSLVAPACLALAASDAGAQAPVGEPFPPEAPPLVAPGSGCAPGHCTHRTAAGRRRCKRRLQECFLGFPEEFERPPLGSQLYAVNTIAVSNAAAASMTLNAYDFERGTARLRLAGSDKLGAIASRLPTSFAPVIVERSGDPALDASRRAAVLTALNGGAFPVPPERVLIGPPIARGLDGQEAEVIREVQLLRTAQGGPPVGIGVAPSQPAVVR